MFTWFNDTEKDYSEFLSLNGVLRISTNFVTGDALRLDKQFENAFILNDQNVVYLRPHNDGKPTASFVWYDLQNKNDKIIDNEQNFVEIQNLPYLLEQITDVMIESYQKRDPIDPYSHFGIRLIDPVNISYQGSGELVLLTGDILSDHAKNDPVGASEYFANIFLDKFMGWNYGFAIVDNPLEKKLLAFNQHLILDGVRKQDDYIGFEVSGVPYFFPRS